MELRVHFCLLGVSSDHMQVKEKRDSFKKIYLITAFQKHSPSNKR